MDSHEHICTVCQRGTLRRSERRGFMERNVYPIFGIFPWRCIHCRTRLRLSDRGPGRHYIKPEPRASGIRRSNP